MTKATSDSAVRAWVALARAERAVLSAIEGALKAAGLPPLAWYDVLLELERAGDERPRPFELEQRLLLAQYNLSRLVDRLVAAGCVEKAPCPDDRRGHVLAITRQGKALLRKMWPVYRGAIETHVGARLGKTRATDLVALLARLMPDRAAE